MKTLSVSPVEILNAGAKIDKLHTTLGWDHLGSFLQVIRQEPIDMWKEALILLGFHRKKSYPHCLGLEAQERPLIDCQWSLACTLCF